MNSDKKLHFRVHVPNLLKEIADCGIPRTHGVLFIPLNQLRIKLAQVAERASVLNDPILNKLMYDMALYGVADPEDPSYDKKAMKEIYEAARLQEEKENK